MTEPFFPVTERVMPPARTSLHLHELEATPEDPMILACGSWS